MKILFAGTPDIAVPTLQALATEFDVVGVLTAPDKVSGRGRKCTLSAVKTAAQSLGLRILQPESLNVAARTQVKETGADLLVVFAYGRIFGPKFLALFPRGGINLHPSALPRHRGPSPLAATILCGDDRTALTIQRIGLEMDAGDIISQTSFPLNGTETTLSLSAAIASAAVSEMVTAVKKISCKEETTFSQNDANATYCRIILKKDGIIDWKTSADQIERMVRAYIPWPKARTFLDSEPLMLLESSVLPDTEHRDSGFRLPGTVLGVDKFRGILIQTGSGILAVTRLQPAFRKSLNFQSFLNGVKLECGCILGEPS